MAEKFPTRFIGPLFFVQRVILAEASQLKSSMNVAVTSQILPVMPSKSLAAETQPPSGAWLSHAGLMSHAVR